MEFLDNFPYFLRPPSSCHCLTIITLWDGSNLTGSQLALSLSTDLITHTQRQSSPVQSLALQDVNAQFVLWVRGNEDLTPSGAWGALEGRAPNVQNKVDFPDHDRLASIAMYSTEGPENF